MGTQLQNVRNDYLRYANCWEDADLLLKGLDVQKGDRVLSIGSAGDNCFSLLSKSPEIVIAIDVNPVQLSLIELKKAAFQTLSHDEFLQFLGFRPTQNRTQLFQKVRSMLKPAMQEYWADRLEDLKRGIIHTGKFERYFRMFRNYLLPLIHSSSTIDQLFTSKSKDEQQRFYAEKWNNRKWRALFKIFFNKYIMGILGRDPAFFKEVDVPVSKYILSQAEQHLSSTYAQNNYFLHYILKGNFGVGLPHYARASSFQMIKNNLDRLHIVKGFAEDAFQQYQRLNKFNLSDIFEYMDDAQFHKVGNKLIDHADADSRFVYWNLMVKRQLPDISLRIEHKNGSIASLAECDKGFFYSSVFIDEKS